MKGNGSIYKTRNNSLIKGGMYGAIELLTECIGVFIKGGER